MTSNEPDPTRIRETSSDVVDVRAGGTAPAEADRAPRERHDARDRAGHDAWHDAQSPTTGGIALIAAAAADSAAHPGEGPRSWSRPWFRTLLAQLMKFGIVGGTGMLVDLGVFNLLRTTLLAPERVSGGVMFATVVATLAAIAWNWLGNRLWTFRQHRRDAQQLREGLEFLGVSLAGMVIGLLPLWLTHYGLGLTSLLADNISKLAGIGIGSVFRFALYRWWVYSPQRTRGE